MKKKILIVGLIALLLAGGLILASCDIDCDGSCVYSAGKTKTCSNNSCAATQAFNNGSGTAGCDCN